MPIYVNKQREPGCYAVIEGTEKEIREFRKLDPDKGWKDLRRVPEAIRRVFWLETEFDLIRLKEGKA